MKKTLEPMGPFSSPPSTARCLADPRPRACRPGRTRKQATPLLVLLPVEHVFLAREAHRRPLARGERRRPLLLERGIRAKVSVHDSLLDIGGAVLAGRW